VNQLHFGNEQTYYHREAVQDIEGDRTLFDLYLKISNAEEQNEKARHEVNVAYYYFGRS
jgi:hypothetical protein